MGKVKKWNDPKIAAVNGSLKLPDTAITVVHRSDGSGTTWIFTNYLAKVSADWSKSVGNDKSVSWPTGVGGKGNQGVASYVQRINGAIGYVESAYASQNHMAHAKLKNHGRLVRRSDRRDRAGGGQGRRLGARQGLLRRADEPARRQRVADHRARRSC